MACYLKIARTSLDVSLKVWRSSASVLFVFHFSGWSASVFMLYWFCFWKHDGTSFRFLICFHMFSRLGLSVHVMKNPRIWWPKTSHEVPHRLGCRSRDVQRKAARKETSRLCMMPEVWHLQRFATNLALLAVALHQTRTSFTGSKMIKACFSTVYIYIGFQSVSLQHPFWRNLLLSFKFYSHLV